MDVYNSSFSAQDLENAIKAVPSIGENGNWYIGDTDTGVYAGGVKVTGSEVGQFIQIAAVDENGVPTAWVPTDPPKNEWRLINTYTIETEDLAKLYFNTDMDENPFELTELYIVGNGEKATTHSGSTSVGVFVRLGDGTHGEVSQSYYDMAINTPSITYQRGFEVYFELLTETMGRSISGALGNQLTASNIKFDAITPMTNGHGKLEAVREIAIFPNGNNVLYGVGTVVSIYGR